MSESMIGKLVRWERKGQWFTARVTGKGHGASGTFAGVVVDPGNYTGVSVYAPKVALREGDSLPNLVPELITVIEGGDPNAE